MATKERKEYKKYHEKFKFEYHDVFGFVKDKYKTEWGLGTTPAYKEAYERDQYLEKKALDSEKSSGGGFSYLTCGVVIMVALMILGIAVFVKDNWQFILWFVSPFVLLVFLIKKKIFWWVERVGFFIGILVCCWSQSFAVTIRSNDGLTNSGSNFIIGILNLISFIAFMILFLVMGVSGLRKLYKKYLDPTRKEIKK